MSVQVSEQERQAFEQLKAQGYKVDWSPEQFYQWVAEQKAKGIRPTFESYMDYLEWVKSSPATQPGGWQPPPKLPEKPTVEDVKRALSEAKSTEHVQAVIEQAKKAGIPIEMSPAFYSEEGVGKLVVAFGDVESGKVVETGIVFKGAGDQNIIASQTAEIDISKEIERAQKEGFQNIQLAIQKTFMACRPEDALRISLTGVKPPPPPPPPKHVIQVTNQPGVTAAAAQLEVPSFEEFRKRPEVAKYPEDAQRQLYNLYLLKTAKEKGYEYVLTPSGWERIPDLANLRVDIVSSLAQYANIPQVQVSLWRMTEGKVYEQISNVEAAIRGFTAGLTSQLTFGLLSLGKLPEPPRLPAPRSFGTVIPSAVEVAPLPEKAKAMEALAPPPQLGIYKAGELAGMTAGIAFQKWLANKAVSTWKSIDIGEVLERYKAGESLTPLERLKLEAWIHTPEKVWSALSEATTARTVKVYAPEEAKLYTVQYKDVAGAAWKLEEAMKDITEKWVMGSPAPRITSLEAPYYKVPVGFKEAGATLKVGELPFSLQPSLVKMGDKGVEALAAFTRTGGGFILKGFPESPLPLASGQTLKVIFPWEKVAEEAGKAASSVLSAGGGAAAGGGGAGLLSSLKLSLGGGGVPGVTLKTITAAKPLPIAFPVIPSLTQAPKLEQKLESKSIALPEIKLEEKAKGSATPSLLEIPLPKLELEEKAKGSAAPFIASIPLPEPKLEPPRSIPFPSVKAVSRSAARAALFPALSPAEAERAGEKAAAALSVLTVPRPAQSLAAPSPTPPSQASGGEKGKLPGLPFFSPPPPSIIYRAPEWRLGKYWRVDWFAEGLKLDFKLGRLAKALAPKTVKVKQVDWLKPLEPKPRAKPKPRRKASSERGTRKAAKRRRTKRKVRAV